MRIFSFKFLFLIFFTGVAALIPSRAATISVMIIETGAVDEAAAGTAYIWESGMMDVFFDEGHIVCNTPAIRISNLDDEEIAKEARRVFEDAGINGVDYFIITQLNYSQNESSKTTSPDKVSLRLYRIAPYSMLYKTSYPANSGIFAAEEFSGVKKAARMLVPYIGGGR